MKKEELIKLLQALPGEMVSIHISAYIDEDDLSEWIEVRSSSLKIGEVKIDLPNNY